MAVLDYDAVYTGIRNRLLANANLTAVVGTRIYNIWRPGTDPVYPRINFGMLAATPNENGVIDTVWQFSIWDDDYDMLNCQAVSMMIEDSLHWTNAGTYTGWEVFWIEKLSSNAVGMDGYVAQVSDSYLIRLREA